MFPSRLCRRIPRWLAIVVCSGLLIPSPTNAQFPPGTLENLTVFPQDISPRELIGVMRTFAMGLGVRCQFCHVGEEGQPLAEFDFVSDEKPTKRKARKMIEMVRDINQQYLAQLDERSDPQVRVACETCHRGVSKPRRIQDILMAEYETNGIDSAIAEYRALREQFYGSFAYDFSERMLMILGGDLVQAAARAESGEARMAELGAASAVLDLNLEYHPESAFTHFARGEAYHLAGDSAAAIASYERTLELMPGNRAARQRLQQIRRD
jgi:hypothetical protein